MFSILSISLYISLNSKRVRFARPSTSVLRGRLETQRSQVLFGVRMWSVLTLLVCKDNQCRYLNFIYHLLYIMRVKFYATILNNCTNYKMNGYSQGTKFKNYLSYTVHRFAYKN